MSGRASIRERAAHWPQGMAEPALRPAGRPVQAVHPVSALRPFRYAEKIAGGHPFAAFRGGIGHGIARAGAPIAADQAVEYQPFVLPEQHDGPAARIAGVQRPDAHRVAIPDRRIHAGPAGAEGDRRTLEKQPLDEMFGVGHNRLISQTERYRKP